MEKTAVIAELEKGYNCLTGGIHHGRPEAIWNLPLRYAVDIYGVSALEEIVVTRIYNDAIQLVDSGLNPRFTEQWADKLRDLAEERFRTVLDSKLEDLGKYYRSSSFQRDVKMVIEQIEKDKLNPGYAPLHGHDTINLMCRILGTSCDWEASKS